MNQTITSTLSVRPLIGFNWSSLLLLTIVAAFAIITNLINITVFLSPKLKDHSYKYLLFNSISGLIASIFIFTSSLFIACSNCATTKTYFSFVYTIYAAFYLPEALSLFRLFLQLILSLHTFCTLTSRTFLNRVSPILLSIILILAAHVLYVYVPFGYVIEASAQVTSTNVTTSGFNKNVQYSLQLSNVSYTGVYRAIGVAVPLLRLLLAIFLLSSVNTLNVIEFRKRFSNRRVGIVTVIVMINAKSKFAARRKLTLTDLNSVNVIEGGPQQIQCEGRQSASFKSIIKEKSSSKVTKNLTKMVILSSLLNVMSTAFYVICYILNASNLIDQSLPHFSSILIVSKIVFYLTPGLDIFIYFFFNKLYKEVLECYAKKLFSHYCK